MTDTGALPKTESDPGIREAEVGRSVAEAGIAGQEVIAQASPEAVRVAIQLGTLFRRMLSYGAASTSLLDSGAYNLSFLEFKTMMNLGVFEEQTNYCLADIAGTTGASMPAVSRAVDSLVRKGLISRIEDPEDRRRRLLSLTDEGHQLANAALLGRAVGAVKLASSFEEDELRELDSLLSRLIEREDLTRIHQQLEGAVKQ